MSFNICWKILILYYKKTFHAFRKILIPYTRFSRIAQTDAWDCSPPKNVCRFLNCRVSLISDFHNYWFQIIYIVLDYLELFYCVSAMSLCHPSVHALVPGTYAPCRHSTPESMSWRDPKVHARTSLIAYFHDNFIYLSTFPCS